MAKFFKKILCPVDFDDNSMAALDTAAELARDNDAVLYLMHVISVPLTTTALPLEPYASVSTEPAKLHLEKIVRERVGRKVRHEIVVKIGEPADQISAAAEDLDADLIVMATHGRSGVAHLFLGSVAEKVIRSAGRSVLTVRPKASAAGRAVRKAGAGGGRL